MKELNFYSILGVAVPGAFTLFAFSFIFPGLRIVFLSEYMGLGNLGVFLTISYVTGQFVQAFGNLLELLWWKLWNGMPSDWPRSGKHRLLSKQQTALLTQGIDSVLSVKLGDSISSLDTNSWSAITRQVYAAVAGANKAHRVDTFNANYGLNRGMATSLVMIGMVILVAEGKPRYGYGLLALAGSLVFLFRMHRFGKHYARELFVQFIDIARA